LLDINFAHLFISFLVLLFALTVHESAHAWTADRLGDPTGRELGRVSLNPAVHADLVGTVLFPLLASLTGIPLIGWAKPVPVNTARLKNVQRDYMLIAAAGPAANLLLAFVSAALLRVVAGPPRNFGEIEVIGPLAATLSMSRDLNLLLAIFNMIPIPPLDGGSVLAGFLPSSALRVFARVRPYGFMLLYALMFTGILWTLMRPVYALLLEWLP
jgi:Zn-dependent protease